ncbi:MAG TPA: hypothetical protein VL334_09365 [Anaerolineae bacterium]|nr:hypothetical protein [Anaerolineae bacterium]
MSTTDLLNRWSTLSLDEIQDELDAGQHLLAAEQLFGADQVAAMRPGEAMRSFSGAREAVVLLPGLMGSLLTSVRGIITSLWLNPNLMLKGQSRYLELNQEGTADASPNILTVATGAERLCYLQPALALNRECILFEFPYDWRLPIEVNADQLGQTLERWADGDPDMQFTLVGHSMGGLVSRAFVTRHPEQAKRRVKRVIMHGTPHFGAAGAIADLMEGNRMMALASALNEKNSIRRFVLNMPSAYQLLPAPPNLFPSHRHYPANFDVYDARQWRLEGVRQDYLDAGRRFHELLADFDHPVETIQIAGCHMETKVDVMLGFDARERPSLQIITQSKGLDSGDATVPLYSAILPGAQMYYIQEVHRYLPRNKQVIEATIDLIYGRTPDLPTDLPQPKQGLLDLFREVGDPETEAERLRQRLSDGVATEQDLEQLYFLDY